MSDTSFLLQREAVSLRARVCLVSLPLLSEMPFVTPFSATKMPKTERKHFEMSLRSVFFERKFLHKSGVKLSKIKEK